MQKLILLILFIVSNIAMVAQTSDTLNQTDKEGQKQGYWKKYSETGLLKYEGRFVNDIPIGEFTYYYPDGEIKAKSVFSQNGSYSYTTTFHLSGVKMTEGFYNNRKKDSTWIYYNSEGTLLKKEFYRNDVKEGVWVSYYPNGKKSEEISWKNDEKNGPWRKYYSNGILQTEGSFKDDMKNGKVDYYYDNGRLSVSGAYENDYRVGEWIYLGTKSNVVKKEIYEEGKLIKSEEFEE